MPLEEREAALLGCPSYLWRFGQERRLALINRYAPLADKVILDVGCGLGTYVERLRRFSDRVYGVDLEASRVAEAARRLPDLAAARAEELPFPPGRFDIVLLHEVIEHVEDDREVVQEAYRVAKPQGRIVIFAPNRLYPFETHGIYWRGRYRFGNFPLVNYLPDNLRRRLVPHVRAYTKRGLLRLLEGLPHKTIVHTQIYPGYDQIEARSPTLAGFLRRLTYALERTPL
ncbi:MAG TPA: class I SAM-dependent methyltransferase, partial [Chloroflexi bacterium]|nr:class I SAM-dependent methyltransferase [Chloroflexota bacterium]